MGGKWSSLVNGILWSWVEIWSVRLQTKNGFEKSDDALTERLPDGAVDDEVDGRVDGGEEVRDAHDRLQPLVPVALHVHAWKDQVSGWCDL